MQGLTTMAKINLVEHMISMEIKTWVHVMDVCMVKHYHTPIAFNGGFCAKTIVEVLHMWSHGNISWKGKIFFWPSLLIFLGMQCFTPWRLCLVGFISSRLNQSFSGKLHQIFFKEIKCGGGWKYNFKNSNVYYKDNGIIKQIIISYTPKLGKDKTKNQTLVKNMFAVLICCVIHVTTYEVGP